MSDNFGSTLRKPPSALRPVTTGATALTSSAAIDVLGASCVQGWVTFQAIGQDVYIILGESDVAAATVNNTMVIFANTSVDWYLTKAERYMRHIALVAGVIKFGRSS